MQPKEKINYGLKFLELRKLLKISQKNFARMASMTQQELDEFEKNEDQDLMFSRLRVCIALERLINHKHENYPSIIVDQIVATIQIINPFNSLNSYIELSMDLKQAYDNILNCSKERVRNLREK